jgi:hypothetical protein
MDAIQASGGESKNIAVKSDTAVGVKDGLHSDF